MEFPAWKSNCALYNLAAAIRIMAKGTTAKLRKRVSELEAQTADLKKTNRGLEESNELLKHRNEWLEKELIEQGKENETEKTMI